MNRRNFLAMATGAIFASLLPIQTKANSVSYEWETRPEIQRLTRKFDRKSLRNKREFIENLGKVKFKAKREDTKELAAEMNKIFKELQLFYRRRLEVMR